MGKQPLIARLSRCAVLLAWLVPLAFVPARQVQAEEPYLEFVQGLRDQQYYDYAILYLDQIATRSNLPAEIKQVIPYQKAMILLDGSKRARTPEKQTEQLVQALAFLEQFVKDSPNHASAGDANSDRAQILLGMGQVEILQSRSPANQGAKREIQGKAREVIAKARLVFQTAYDQHAAAFKKFPSFIDDQKDRALAADRAKVEVNMITAMLNLGMCTYHEAQSHDQGSMEFKQLLDKAAGEFETMHQKYRSQVGGLFARAWQGKCYEEQNDLQKAMGIYNELLDHPGNEGPLSRLKAQTLYFKLICLNSKDRNDNQLAADLAEEWLKKNQAESRTETGLGIQWEQAKAHEALGDKAARDVKADAERGWRQARTLATQINKYPGEFKDSSLAMIQRLQVKLGGKEQVPKDFDTAFGLAGQSFKAALEIAKEIEGGKRTKRPADEIAKLEQDRRNEISDAAKNFDLALGLATKRDDPKSLSEARLWYAYVNYWQDKNYEAAVLAQYVARTADKDNGTVGLDAAFMAMAAFVKAYNDNKAPLNQKAEDIRMIIRACNMITDRWPASEKANDARMTLGRIYGDAKKPAEAAAWFGKVPDSDPGYPKAQTAAGQAYLTAYYSAGRSPGADKPSVEQLGEWLKLAEQHLRNGIDKLTASLPKEGAAPPELISAKMSLAQIIISQGKDAEAIKLLLDDPHSVVKAVSVADESKRPDKGVTSRKFAVETFKLLLRAYIGSSNLDKGREVMRTLEGIVAADGTDAGSDVTELYVGLGRLLKDELERLRNNGETDRYNNLMGSFETFLNDMASRKEGQSFGSLSWVGETYFALGETVSSDAAKSIGFYEKAGTAFADILTRAAADASFAKPEQLLGVKIRQVRVHRLKKEFEPAELLMGEVLKVRPNDIKAQFAACEVYQDWGASGQADSAKKLLNAIRGNDKIGAWGWGQIGFKLQKSKSFKTDPTVAEAFLDARFNGTQSRQRYARDLPPKDRQKELERCLTELVTTASVSRNMPDERFAKFNALYRDVLQDAGKAAEDLPRSQSAAPVAEVEKPDPAPVKPAATKQKETSAAKSEAPKSSDTMTIVVLIGILLLGGAVAAWMFLKPKLKKAAWESVSEREPSPMTFGGGTGPESRSGPEFVSSPMDAPKPRPRPASAGGGQAGSATKSASKPTAPGVAATPKPKPKPPTPPSNT